MSLSQQITGISHIGIRVHSLDRARAFYELLGFNFVMGPIGPEPVAVMSHPAGIEVNFILNAAETSAENVLMDIEAKHAGYTHMALSVQNISDVQLALEKAGVLITGGPITFPGGSVSIFVRDPDRNVIEFNQRA
ncbi:VOC family protein [Methylomonas paludis]|uniref:VOC family protein n=1 Tax=Methylomonas paludis TaxID=1173101 RepID=A0A975RAX3_9GAMM|nr:VOC family protein [Methylomonas paludis]QWF71793.1 VOC family protein [Methylomonas paludis]